MRPGRHGHFGKRYVKHPASAAVCCGIRLLMFTKHEGVFEVFDRFWILP